MANPYTPGVIRVGCEVNTVQEWRDNLPEIMETHSVFPEHEDEIRAKIEWLAGWFEVYHDAMTISEMEEVK
jgi:hypothetical protein